MYAPTYGFGQGGNNGAQQQQQQQQQLHQQQAAFSPNNVPPAAHALPHYFQGQQPQQPQAQQQQQHQQHQQQHPQHQQIMYNAQQYGAPVPGGAGGPGPQQNPYAAMGINPAMIQGNGGVAHMTVNNGVVQGYQTPYSSSPYNTGMSNPPGAMPMQQQQQFMTPTSNNVQFPMNPAAMTPQQQQQQQQQHHQQQQQQQRMQPPQASPIPNSQRVSPYGGAPQSTPPQAQTQSQFITPQGPVSNQPHQVQTANQTQNNNPPQTQQPGQNTPQTPNFPPNLGGTAGPHNVIQTPMSPASENREKERVSLLLDINRELLMEVMRLQALQAEAKKENSSNASTLTDTKDGDSKPPEKPNAAVTGKEFVECMRRLQANLAYLAAIADRSHKPSSQIPPHPAIISAPPLSPIRPKHQVKQSPKASPTPNPNLKTESTTSSEGVNDARNGTPNNVSDVSPEEVEDRLETIKSLYSRLQALFPGVDPKKEPPIQSANKNAQQKVQAQRQNTNPAQNQMSGQVQGTGMMVGGKMQQSPQGIMGANMVSQGP